MAVNMNRNRLLLGSFVAGVLLNIGDYLSNVVIFADRMRAESNAFQPGLGDRMAAMGGGEIATYVFFDFIVGFLLVWTYAAIRPRFGPGPRTAMYGALIFFVFGMILTFGYKQMGVMSQHLWWSYSAAWLVNLTIASLAGAFIYSEGDAAKA